jgi:hypothetical protein
MKPFEKVDIEHFHLQSFVVFEEFLHDPPPAYRSILSHRGRVVQLYVDGHRQHKCFIIGCPAHSTSELPVNSHRRSRSRGRRRLGRSLDEVDQPNITPESTPNITPGSNENARGGQSSDDRTMFEIPESISQYDDQSVGDNDHTLALHDQPTVESVDQPTENSNLQPASSRDDTLVSPATLSSRDQPTENGDLQPASSGDDTLVSLPPLAPQSHTPSVPEQLSNTNVNPTEEPNISRNTTLNVEPDPPRNEILPISEPNEQLTNTVTQISGQVAVRVPPPNLAPPAVHTEVRAEGYQVIVETNIEDIAGFRIVEWKHSRRNQQNLSRIISTFTYTPI